MTGLAEDALVVVPCARISRRQDHGNGHEQMCPRMTVGTSGTCRALVYEQQVDLYIPNSTGTKHTLKKAPDLLDSEWTLSPVFEAIGHLSRPPLARGEQPGVME